MEKVLTSSVKYIKINMYMYYKSGRFRYSMRAMANRKIQKYKIYHNNRAREKIQ